MIFSCFLHYFVLAKLATTCSIRVNRYVKRECCNYFVEAVRQTGCWGRMSMIMRMMNRRQMMITMVMIMVEWCQRVVTKK